MMAQRCVHCNEFPHQALQLICSTPNCRNLICGTDIRRTHCMNRYLISREARLSWNKTERRVEICGCTACGGTILNLQIHQELRTYYNNCPRRCDHFNSAADCWEDWAQTHAELETHMWKHPKENLPELTNFNVDYNMYEEAPNRCFICRSHPHEPFKLRCNDHCAHFICGTSRFRSNCFDEFLSIANCVIVKWDTATEALFLTRCPSSRNSVTSIEVLSATVTDYFNKKRRKCDWKGEDGDQYCGMQFEGNHYEIEQHIISYHLHGEADGDDNDNDGNDGGDGGEGSGHVPDDDHSENNENAAMESNEQEESPVSSVSSCSRHWGQRRLAIAFLSGMS